MFLPDFFVVGAPKSGTTALFDCLKQHPDIFMSPVKEPKYFLFGGAPPRIQPGPAGKRNLGVGVWRSSDYFRLFAGAQDHQKKGEATTDYLRSPEAAHRIKGNLPKARIIALLRQPADRAYSHYLYMVQQAVEPARTFQEALAEEGTRIAQDWFSGLYYKTNGFYGRQLRVWYDLFPRDQIKVCLYEDWCRTPHAMLADVFQFLKVNPDFQPVLARSNVTRVPRSRRLHSLALRPEQTTEKWGRLAAAIIQRMDQNYNLSSPPPLEPLIRQKLTEEYREDTLSLQELIGRDLSQWL